MADIAARQIERGVAHPLLALTIDRFEFGIADPIGDRAEGGSRLDRLQLFGIADQHELGAGLGDGLDEQRHLPRRHHAGLVQHENGLVVELVAALVPAQLPGRQRAGLTMPASFSRPSAALPASAPPTTR